jgi:hypothetical protein
MHYPRLLFHTIVIAVALVSCSSPEGDGRKAALDVNNCAEKCIESMQKLESEFVSNFNPHNYTWRSEAIDAYNKKFKRICDDYYRDLDAVLIRNSKLKGEYADNYKDLEKFDAAYEDAIDEDLSLKASNLILTETIPTAVIASINSIIPPKPDENRIKKDLEGHSISEGFDKKDCYFSEKWRRTFGEDVEIKELHLDEITQDDIREYSFVTTMILQEKYLSYNAKAQVYYTLQDGEDWKIEFVKSLGLKLIQTHKYDDCIRCVIEDDGWGGVDALFITNTSEVELLVIGHCVADNVYINFSKIIPPGEKGQVGGLFFGGNITHYEIVAVERHL